MPRMSCYCAPELARRWRYESRRVELEPGDLVLMLSDDGLRDLVARHVGEAAPPDDVTLLAVRLRSR